jgi:hypothetical protein
MRIFTSLLIILHISLFSLITGSVPIQEYLLGKYNPQDYPSLFDKVPSKYCTKNMYLRKEVLQRFIQMAHEARKQGITLKVVSGYRSYEHQKNIWETKYNSTFKLEYSNPEKRINKILNFSAVPGTSRHHWGTDIDINSLQNNYFQSGYGKRVKKWLEKNASSFGFYKSYDNSPKRKGYEPEDWHYSYAPLSVPLLEAYLSIIKPKNLLGFSGDTIISTKKILEEYVKGVPDKLLPVSYRKGTKK